MNIPEQLSYLTRGTTEIISVEQLKEKLRQSEASGTPLKVKAGFDPTAPDLHLGHLVLLHKLAQFQKCGHDVYFLIGDFTAQIGDPTGKDKLRPKLSREQIETNAKTYREQVFKVLDPTKTKIVFNSEWLDRLSSRDALGLARYSTVAQMFARADFKKRMEDGKEISILEFLYPLLQGYDSVHLKADVELGGNDQKFNLLMGRQLQEAAGRAPQVVLMTPLLEGTDGVQKMSKSLGNYVGLNDTPKDMFGKLMSISDDLMYRYFELLTDHDLAAVKAMHPKEAKMFLASTLVAQFYGEEAARREREGFEKTFSQGLIPQDIETIPIADASLPDLLVAAKIVKSKNECRRLLKEGAITFEGTRIEREDWRPQPGVLKVGKKRFVKLIS
jgi:tyrosyl-tRNA synthetase